MGGSETSAFCNRGVGVKHNPQCTGMGSGFCPRSRLRRMMGFEGETDQAKRRA